MTKKGRPTLNDSLALREAILTVALEEFLRHGYEGVNIDVVSRRAGAGRVTIYRQFGGKEGLFRAALEQPAAALKADLPNVIVRNRPPEETLLKIIEQIYLDFTHPDVLAVARLCIAESVRFPEICTEIANKLSREILAPLVSYLEMLKNEDRLDLGEPNVAAQHLVDMTVGGFLFLIQKPLTGPKARKQWALSVLDMILPALRQRGTK